MNAEDAYDLGFAHGAEMGRESGSGDGGWDGWDGMLVNADPAFVLREFGPDESDSRRELLLAYSRGAQAGADAAVDAAHLARNDADVAKHNALLHVQEHMAKLDAAVQARVAREGVVRYEFAGTWMTLRDGASIEYGQAFFADETSCIYTFDDDARVPYSYRWCAGCGIPY